MQRHYLQSRTLFNPSVRLSVCPSVRYSFRSLALLSVFVSAPRRPANRLTSACLPVRVCVHPSPFFCSFANSSVSSPFRSSVRLSFRPCLRPSARLVVRLIVRPSVHPSVRSSVISPLHSYVRPSSPLVRPSVCPSVRPYVRPSVCPSVCQSARRPLCVLRISFRHFE